MIELGTTAFGHASTCLKRYEYSNILKLAPKYELVAPKIRKGIWMHALLAAYHNGQDWEAKLGDLIDWAEEHHVPAEAIEEISQACRSLMIQYIAYWSDPSRKDAWEVISTEYPYEREFPKLGVKLRATVDMVVRDRSGVWIVEHKTTSHIPDPLWRSVDPQTAIQLYLVESSGIPVEGILFNYVLTKDPPVPEVTKKGLFSERKIVTTSWAFDQAKAVVVSEWKSDKGDFGDMSKYLDMKRAEMVNDSLWFQRFRIFRSPEMLLETMRDVAATVGNIKAAAERGHYLRARHIISCQQFCTYGDLCATEYQRGTVSHMREEMFMTDTGEREGR